MQFPFLRKNMTGNIQSGNKYLKAPDDYLATYSLAVIDSTGAYEYLLNKDVNFIRQSYPNPTTDVGTPKYYALFGPAIVGSAVVRKGNVPGVGVSGVARARPEVRRAIVKRVCDLTASTAECTSPP